jgi:hypothetical protein
MGDWFLAGIVSGATALVLLGGYLAHSLLFHGFKPLWRVILNT